MIREFMTQWHWLFIVCMAIFGVVCLNIGAWAERRLSPPNPAREHPIVVPDSRPSCWFYPGHACQYGDACISGGCSALPNS